MERSSDVGEMSGGQRMYPKRFDGLLKRMGEDVEADPLREWLAESPPVEDGKNVDVALAPPR